MGRLTSALVVGLLAITLFAGWGARASLDATGTTSEQNSAQSQAIPQPESALESVLEASEPPAYVTRDAEGSALWKQTRAFYEKRAFAPVWSRHGSPLPQTEAFIRAISAAHHDGFDTSLYNVDLFDGRKLGTNQAAATDTYLTYLYMKFASDLADGVSDVARAEPAWKIKTESVDPLDRLERAVEDNRVAESLSDLTPEAPAYRALRQALAQYREYAMRGAWPTVPSDIKVKPGQVSEHVPAIARRLAASGDYAGALPADGQATAYTADLQEAVRRFQRRHGLTDDGVVGAAAAAEMNVPLAERIRQIELNLERWRWMPRNLGDRYVLVNIPEMRLNLWEGDTVGLTMRVVVGKKDTPTPIFDEKMKYLVFSPYWNVPPDIAKDETLPSVMKDAGFLDRMNMEVVDKAGNTIDPATIDLTGPGSYRFRQRPGPSNSLGLVKFMFPNEFNVYLHDTPADALFARASRAFSHGCVRLEQPQTLAEYVLRDQPEWTPERIREAMNGGQERTVNLKTPLPVYIGYWTASVSPDGLVQFRKDVYGIDGRLAAAIGERQQRLRAGAMAAASLLKPTQLAAAATQ
jgi:murein L,D-transpeptidase YcbB/YkuD